MTRIKGGIRDDGTDPDGDDMAARMKAKWAPRITCCPRCGIAVIPVKIGGLRGTWVLVAYGSAKGQAQPWHLTYKPSQHAEHRC